MEIRKVLSFANEWRTELALGAASLCLLTGSATQIASVFREQSQDRQAAETVDVYILNNQTAIQNGGMPLTQTTGIE